MSVGFRASGLGFRGQAVRSPETRNPGGGRMLIFVVQRALQALVEAEVVVGEAGEYRISEPFLAQWVVSNISRG